MYEAVLDQIQTVDDLLLLQEELDKLSKSLYKTSQTKFEDVLTNEVRGSTASAMRKELEKFSGNKNEYLEGLAEEIKNFKKIEMRLAFEPSEAAIRRFSNWVKNEAGRNSVLEIRYDRSILAGVILVFKGEYRDYSVRRKLKDYYRI